MSAASGPRTCLAWVGRARRPALTVGLAVALAVTLVQIPAVGSSGGGADPRDRDGITRPAPEVDQPFAARGRLREPIPLPPNTTRNAPIAPVEWPAAGRANVDIPAQDSKFARAGSGPISVADPKGPVGERIAEHGTGPGRREGTGARPGPPSAETESVDSPQRVSVQVAARDQVAALGIDGVLAQVSVDPASEPGPVAVKINYSGFGHAYGGDWGTRLRLVAFPACALTTPQRPECRQVTLLPSLNDTRTQTVTGIVDLTAGPGTDPAIDPATARSVLRPAGRGASTSLAQAESAGGMVVAATAAAGGAQGSWAATPVTESASWAAGGSTGEASWSYPLRTPPVAGSLAPSLAISYSSATVDGRTSSKNNQTSWVGEGFGTGEGFITRRYLPCGQDQKNVNAQAPNNADRLTGDLCWKNHNAVLSFGGGGGELIATNDQETQWRKINDDGTRIVRRLGADNGDDNGEYWELTTPDGTRYFFGLGHAAGENSGPGTGSAWTVPVYGNHPDEPGNATAFGDSWVDQAWRWNLDRVIDVHGNSMSYYYAREQNRYARNLTADAATPYTRGGYLTRIEYGQRAGEEGATGQPPVAQVLFEVAERCISSTPAECDEGQIVDHPGRWPDVPKDQICTGDTCSSDQFSPSFFTRKRLTGITTEVRATAAEAWVGVDRWELVQQFPSPDDGTSASLWLEQIRHTGLGEDPATGQPGTPITLPAVSFEEVALDNRVDGIDNERPFRKFRVASVHSESGKTLTFVYSGERCGGSAAPPTGCTPDPQLCDGGLDNLSTTDDTLPGSQHNNTMLCFPVYYTPELASEPDEAPHWFHKYVVDAVTEMDRSGASPPVVTRYTYVGSPAWAWSTDRFGGDEYRTWDDWRGYARVLTTVGEGSLGTQRLQTETLYYRGLHGTRANGRGEATYEPKVVKFADSEDTGDPDIVDHWRFQGMARETITRNGPGGPEVSATIAIPWHSPGTNARPSREVLLAGVETTRARAPLAAGGTRVTVTHTDLDDIYGMPTQVEDLAGPGTADDMCTTMTYDRDLTKWILDRVAGVTTVPGACSAPSGALPVAANRNVYDAAGRMTESRTLSGFDGTVPRFTLAGTTTYDEYGRATSLTDALGQVSRTSYTHASVDGIGPLTAITLTSPDPDGLGLLTPHVTTTAIDPRWGAPAEVVEPSGNTTRAAYDALGRLTSVWFDGRARTAPPDTTYAYELRALGPNAVTTGTRINDALGERYLSQVQLYDGLMRPRQTQTEAPASGDQPAGRVISSSIYDSRGLLVREERETFTPDPVSAENVWISLSPTQTPGAMDLSWDGAGRPTVSAFQKVIDTNADGNPDTVAEDRRTVTAYDGSDQITVTPPTGGVKTTTVTDARGRMVKLQQHGDAMQTTTFTHTPLGQVASVTDPAGNTWTHSYDPRGNRTESTDPDTGRSTSTYDAAGQLLTSTDAQARTLALTYDALGRRTSLRDGSALGPVRASWIYDPTFGGGPQRSGLPASMTRHVGLAQIVTTVTGYDAGDRPTGTSTTIPEIPGLIDDGLDGTYTTSRTYHDDGAPATTTLPAYGPIQAERLRHHYDKAGAPYALTGAGAYVADTIRSPFGEALRYGFGNTWKKASWQTLRYEEGTRRLTEARVDREDAAVTDEVSTYSYDLAGNPLRIGTDRNGTAGAATADDETQCFTYDKLRRLSGAWAQAGANATCAASAGTASIGGPAPYAQSWEFDQAGNRTSQIARTGAGASGAVGSSTTTSTYAYPAPGAHLLDSVTHAGSGTGAVSGTETYSYDDTGNTTARSLLGGAQDMVWDAEGHLSEVLGPAGVIEQHLYDADGSRLIRRDHTTNTTTLFLGDTELTVHRDKPAGDPGRFSWARYYSFDGKTVAVRDGNAMTDVQVLISDPHNTSTYAIETNATATLLPRRTLPYGAPRGPQPGGYASTRGFVDGTLDPGSGLTLIGARHYDPASGRFISADPIIDHHDPGQVNGYTYANNSPLAFSDPTGLRLCGNDSCSIFVNSGGQVQGPGYSNGEYVGTPAPTPAVVAAPAGSGNSKFGLGGLVNKVTSTVKAITPAAANTVNFVAGVGRGGVAMVEDIAYLASIRAGCLSSPETMICSALQTDLTGHYDDAVSNVADTDSGAYHAGDITGQIASAFIPFAGQAGKVGSVTAKITKGAKAAIAKRASAKTAAEVGGAVLRPSSLADEVANATGGLLKANKGGYTVQVPYGSRGITVRVMEQGGGRTNYYRVSVPGKETYTVTGEASTDAALTHIDIGASSRDDILSIIARIQGGG